MLTAADLERARTWIKLIIEALIEGVKWRQEGNELRALDQGGLSINTLNGCWYSHSAKQGSWSVIPLIILLKGCSQTEAEAWVAIWLKAHPGTGTGVAGNGDDAVIDNAAIARAFRDKVVEPETQTQTYICQTRGIKLTSFTGLPVRSLRFARTGESAIVGLLTAHGRETGMLLTYIDAHGQKSLVAPQRRRFNMEKAPGAVFELRAPDNATELQADTVVCEGLEDFLSVVSLGRSWAVKGLPGIGTLRHLSVRQGERILIIRDGDSRSSPADKALIAGVDHLLNEGAAVVRVTATPPGEDANSILQKEGPEGLLALINASTPAQLSIDGEVTRLSRLERLEYAQRRLGEAKRLGITAEVLDAEVKQQRRTAGVATEPEESPPDNIGHGLDLEDPVPWPEEVDGRSLLDELEATIRRFIVLDEQGIVVSVLWVIGTYVFHQFPIFPRLFATAPERGCGKTTLLDLLELLTPRAVKVENITTAALFRTIEAARPTMILDEADTYVPHNEELRGVVDSGHKKNGAVIRLIEIAGQYVPHKFSTFAPMALAAIKRLPGTIEDRSLLVNMKRRRADETVESLYRAEGITDVARKLARWSADNGAELSVADPEMPDGIMNRTADNWHPMFAIADRIGGDCPSRARQVAVTLNNERDTGSVEVELLADIRAAFEASSTVPALSSDQLVAGLILLEDRPWGEIKNGRPLTKHGLARYLRSFHISPGTIRLSNGTTPKGYKLVQFKDAFERYLLPTSPPPIESIATTPQAAENKANRPDFKPQQETSCGGSKRAENPSNSEACGDVAGQNGEGTGRPGEKTGSEPEPAAYGDGRENGDGEPDKTAAPGYKRRLTALEREIIAYDEVHPGTSLDHLRKKFGGRSKEAIAELLGRAL